MSGELSSNEPRKTAENVPQDELTDLTTPAIPRSFRSEAVVALIESTALESFVNHHEVVFHQLSRFLAEPSIHGCGGCSEFRRGNPKQFAEYLELRKELIDFYDRIEEAFPRFRAAVNGGSRTEVAHVYCTELLPKLDSLLSCDGLLARIEAHYEALNQSWFEANASGIERDRFDTDYYREFRSNSRVVIESLEAFRYDHAARPEAVPLAQTVLTSGGYMKVEHIDSAASVMAIKGELEYVVEQLSKDLIELINDVRQTLHDKILGKTVIRHFLEQGELDDLTREMVREAVFYQTRPTLTLTHTGQLLFRFEPEAGFWTEAAPHVQKGLHRLELRRPVIEALGGTLSIDQSTDALEVVVEFPIIASATDAYLDVVEDRLNERNRGNWSDLPSAMMKVDFAVDLQLDDGSVHELTIDGQGGMIMSPAAREMTLKLIDRSRFFIEACPVLNSLSLSATGGEQMIVDAYAAGSVDIHLWEAGAREEPAHSRSYRFIAEPSFGGERDRETQFLDTYQGRGAALHFDSNSFFDPHIGPLVADVIRSAVPLQFSIDHDQDSRYGGADETLTQLTYMAHDLQRVLKELRLTHGFQNLHFDLLPVIAFRVAQIGAHDEMFSLKVYEGEDQCAEGHFSRSQGRFEYKVLNRADELRIEGAVLPMLRELEHAGIVSASLVTRLLAEKEIILDEKLVDRLVAAARGEGGDDLFGPPRPSNVLRSQLRLPATVIEHRGATLVVRLEEVKPASTEPAIVYGHMLNVDGTLGDAITNLQTAQYFVREGSSWFRPTDALGQVPDQEML